MSEPGVDSRNGLTRTREEEMVMRRAMLVAAVALIAVFGSYNAQASTVYSGNDSVDDILNHTDQSVELVAKFDTWDTTEKEFTDITGPYQGFSITVNANAYNDDHEALAGTWSYDSSLDGADFWKKYKTLYVAVKAGKKYELYTFTNGETGGKWDTSRLGGKGVSHISFYGSPSAVPIPPTAVLFGSGLLGLLGRRRKEKV